MHSHVIYVVVATVVLFGLKCSSELTVLSLKVRSHIRYRFATTVVTSTVVNDDPQSSQEALFEMFIPLSVRAVLHPSHIRFRFPKPAAPNDALNGTLLANQEVLFEMILPEEAFVSGFSMTVDGEVYPGRVEEKKSAMKAYQTAKQQGQTAGYIKTTARNSNKFDVSVNLKLGSVVTFNLTYQQLLVRRHGMYEHWLHVNPGCVVRDLKVEVFLEEIRKFTKLEISMKNRQAKNLLHQGDVRVEVPSTLSRYIVYKPTRSQQKQAGDNGLSGEFVVKYDVERTKSAGEVLVVDGYFLHFFAPENTGDLTPVPKDIVFVLDISGCTKRAITLQVQDAMRTILKELSRDDTFNIFSSNEKMNTWRQTLVPVTSNSVRDAMDHVSVVCASADTDINMALSAAVKFLESNRIKSHVPIIFFFTDGQPASAVQGPVTIAYNVKHRNMGMASIYGLAFGAEVDYNLVKIISVQNGGFARRIYQVANASEQVKGFYDEIQSTMMQNLTVSYLNGTVQKDSLTPTTFGQVFKGNDVVIAGRVAVGSGYINSINGFLTAKTSKGMVKIALNNDADNVLLSPDPQPNLYFKMPVDFASVTEKTWAYLTIKELLKQKIRATYKEKEEVDDLDKRILKLSLKYKFVTPSTAMMATKPDGKTSPATVQGDEFDTQGFPGTSPNMPTYRYRPAVASFQGSRGRVDLWRRYPKRAKGSTHRITIERKRPPLDYRPIKKHYQSDQQAVEEEVVVPSITTFDPFSSDTKGLTGNVRRKMHGSKSNKSKQEGGKRGATTCRLVKVILEGIRTTLDNKTKCVKVKRVQRGTFLLYPEKATTSDFTVQAIFTGGNRKPNLKEVKIILQRDNRIYHIVLNHGINTITWWSPESAHGHVTVHKHVVCRGRRGKARVFINIQPGQQTRFHGISKHNARRQDRSSSGKAKKRFSAFHECHGRPDKEQLKRRSERYIGDGEAADYTDYTNIKFKL